MAGPADFYSYDGESKFTRSGLNWELRLLTSGTLKFRTAVSADLFAVGGGGAGGLYGGGGSGYTNTVRAQSLPSASLSVTIGDGGAAVAASGSATSLVNGETTVITANGGNGGSSNSNSRSGGNGGSGGGSGSYGSGKVGGYGAVNGGVAYNGTTYAATKGGYTSGNSAKVGSAGTSQGKTTCAFEEDDGELFASGGNAVYSNTNARPYATHTYTSGEANTGSGGGANTGLGGSGILIIRNAR